jgi:hypothetical protein
MPVHLNMYCSSISRDITLLGQNCTKNGSFECDDNFQVMTLESAISLLEKQVQLQPTCKLHQMLGDLLARVHEEEKALDHYSIALK